MNSFFGCRARQSSSEGFCPCFWCRADYEIILYNQSLCLIKKYLFCVQDIGKLLYNEASIFLTRNHRTRSKSYFCIFFSFIASFIWYGILIQFIQDNRLRLKDLFSQFDKDHSGDISKEEFKTGLKETGIEMSNFDPGGN